MVAQRQRHTFVHYVGDGVSSKGVIERDDHHWVREASLLDDHPLNGKSHRERMRWLPRITHCQGQCSESQIRSIHCSKLNVCLPPCTRFQESSKQTRRLAPPFKLFHILEIFSFYPFKKLIFKFAYNNLPFLKIKLYWCKRLRKRSLQAKTAESGLEKKKSP